MHMHEPKVMVNFNKYSFLLLNKRRRKTYSGDKFAIVVCANFCSFPPKIDTKKQQILEITNLNLSNLVFLEN